MAEKLKVFVNKIFTNQDINPDGTIALFGNDTTTQAVVKNFEVDGVLLKNGLQYYVQNDGFRILTDLESAEGSEIIDTGKALRLKTDLDFTDNVLLDYKHVISSFSTNTSVGFFNSTASVITKTISGTYNAAGFYPVTTNNLTLYKPVNRAYKSIEELKSKYPYTVSTTTTTTCNVSAVSTSTTYTVPNMNTPAWFYSTGTNAYYFYWSGDSNTELFKATITNGIVGSWTSAGSTSYAVKALDIEGKSVYWNNGSTLYKYNMVTGSESTVTSALVNTSNSRYQTATFSNGVYFYIPSNSYSTQCYYYNTNTNTAGVINFGATNNFNSYMSIAVAYNSTEDKWYIDVGYATSRKIFTTTGAMTGTKTATLIGTEALLPFTLYTNQGLVQGDKYGRMLYKCTASGGLVQGFVAVKWANNTATVIGNAGDTFSVNYWSPIDINTVATEVYVPAVTVSPSSQTVVLDINDDTVPISIPVKVSGVEITGVN